MEETARQWPRHPSLKKGRPGWVRVPAKCHRCGGAGGAEAWRHTGWTCYQCGGSGAQPNGERQWFFPVEWTDEQCAENQAVREAKARARREAKEAKRAEAWAAFKAEHGTPEEWVIAEAFGNGFTADVLWRGAHYGSISDAQLAALGPSIERDAERARAEAAEKAAERPVPTGRVEIEGVVLAKKSQEGDWGSTLKMLVKSDGFRVWGSVPHFTGEDGCYEYVEIGDSVRFRATVEASVDDPSFGFFKRPTNAEITERAPDEEEEA